MSLYMNEINRQLSSVKYRSLKREADAERAMKAALEGRALWRRWLLSCGRRLVAAIGGRLNVGVSSRRGEPRLRGTSRRASEHRQHPVS